MGGRLLQATCKTDARMVRRLFHLLWAAQLLGLLVAPRLLGGSPAARRWRAAFSPAQLALHGGLSSLVGPAAGLAGLNLGLSAPLSPVMVPGGVGVMPAGGMGSGGGGGGARGGARAAGRRLAGAAAAAAAWPAVALCNMAEDPAVWWPLVRSTNLTLCSLMTLLLSWRNEPLSTKICKEPDCLYGACADAPHPSLLQAIMVRR